MARLKLFWVAVVVEGFRQSLVVYVSVDVSRALEARDLRKMGSCRVAEGGRRAARAAGGHDGWAIVAG